MKSKEEDTNAISEEKSTSTFPKRTEKKGKVVLIIKDKIIVEKDGKGYSFPITDKNKAVHVGEDFIVE